MKLDFNHKSVLLEESIEALNIKPEGIYIDGTLGGAGHSKEIAKKLTTGMLIGIDKDISAIKAASKRLSEYPQVTLVEGDFREIPNILDSLSINKVDGILLDLGVSSHQLDTPERGFSYRFDAPLDMRMSKSGQTAFDVVNSYDIKDLTRILRDYGEEKFAYSIAKKIITEREKRPIQTTFELSDIIKNSIPAAARRTGGHPAKRSFQAIRIEVNGELAALEKCLGTSFERLNQNGRFAIITFHSLEDRMVKHDFKEYCTGCVCPPSFPICVCGKTPAAKLVSRKPIVAAQSELEENNRSHSAKLRVIKKL